MSRLDVLGDGRSGICDGDDRSDSRGTGRIGTSAGSNAATSTGVACGNIFTGLGEVRGDGGGSASGDGGHRRWHAGRLGDVNGGFAGMDFFGGVGDDRGRGDFAA